MTDSLTQAIADALRSEATGMTTERLWGAFPNNLTFTSLAAQVATAVRAHLQPTVDSHDLIAAMPPGTILRAADGQAWYRGTGSWVGSGDGPAYSPEEGWGLEALPLPAAILYYPQEAS